MSDILCSPATPETVTADRQFGAGFVGAACIPLDGVERCGGYDEFGPHYAVYEIHDYTPATPNPPLSPNAQPGAPGDLSAGFGGEPSSFTGTGTDTPPPGSGAEAPGASLTSNQVVVALVPGPPGSTGPTSATPGSPSGATPPAAAVASQAGVEGRVAVTPSSALVATPATAIATPSNSTPDDAASPQPATAASSTPAPSPSTPPTTLLLGLGLGFGVLILGLLGLLVFLLIRRARHTPKPPVVDPPLSALGGATGGRRRDRHAARVSRGGFRELRDDVSWSGGLGSAPPQISPVSVGPPLRSPFGSDRGTPSPRVGSSLARVAAVGRVRTGSESSRRSVFILTPLREEVGALSPVRGGAPPVAPPRGSSVGAVAALKRGSRQRGSVGSMSAPKRMSSMVGEAEDPFSDLGLASPGMPTTETGMLAMLNGVATEGGGGVEGRRFACAVSYVPQLPDEVGLRVGDVVWVGRVFADGWARGVNETLGVEGAFPLYSLMDEDEEEEEEEEWSEVGSSSSRSSSLSRTRKNLGSVAAAAVAERTGLVAVEEEGEVSPVV
ncbi:hypothetical protein HDU96_010972 [Phlyctochytrium bullatum]|nr:hypothetical protein HDU96_010972 [Phlyctochytrium bullatum]